MFFGVLFKIYTYKVKKKKKLHLKKLTWKQTEAAKSSLPPFPNWKGPGCLWKQAPAAGVLISVRCEHSTGLLLTSLGKQTLNECVPFARRGESCFPIVQTFSFNPEINNYSLCAKPCAKNWGTKMKNWERGLLQPALKRFTDSAAGGHCFRWSPRRTLLDGQCCVPHSSDKNKSLPHFLTLRISISKTNDLMK